MFTVKQFTKKTVNLKCFSLIIAFSWDRMSLTSDKSSEKNRIEESIFKSTLSLFCPVQKLAENFSFVKLPKKQKKNCAFALKG